MNHQPRRNPTVPNLERPQSSCGAAATAASAAAASATAAASAVRLPFAAPLGLRAPLGLGAAAAAGVSVSAAAAAPSAAAAGTAAAGAAAAGAAAAGTAAGVVLARFLGGAAAAFAAAFAAACAAFAAALSAACAAFAAAFCVVISSLNPFLSVCSRASDCRTSDQRCSAVCPLRRGGTVPLARARTSAAKRSTSIVTCALTSAVCEAMKASHLSLVAGSVSWLVYVLACSIFAARALAVSGWPLFAFFPDSISLRIRLAVCL